MKAIIVRAIGDLVKEKFGRDKWEEILEKSGYPKGYYFLTSQDIDDGKVMGIIGSTCEVLNAPLDKVIDLFGIYWVSIFAPKFYTDLFKKFTSARDMLTKMNSIHTMIVQNTVNARPPAIEYNWQDKNTLIMTYKSERGLIDLFVALIKGVGVYFKENIEVSKVDDRNVKVVFPQPQQQPGF
ncbi:MAG: heme NO-binding domain-containing protein [bacterium]